MLHAFDSFDSIPSSQGAAPSAMTPALYAVSEEDGRDARVDAAMSGAPRSDSGQDAPLAPPAAATYRAQLAAIAAHARATKIDARA